MIVWLNGTFGVGKTTTAGLVAERLSNSRIFDPEHVGYMLSANLKDIEFSDFQDLTPWRSLVPQVLRTIHEFTGSRLIAPQTVLREDYWIDLRNEMHAGIGGLDVMHIVLDCDSQVLRHRIGADHAQPDAVGWRQDHVARFEESRAWMIAAADLVVDTTAQSPTEVADAIVATIESS